VLILAPTLAEIQLANDTQLPNSTTRNVRRNILTQREARYIARLREKNSPLLAFMDAK
jgi:hypothetical protein